jgi:CheY-like chemotaxis protein
MDRPGGADTEEVPVARGYRILVVDDDLAIVATLQVILEIEGYVVETASNGAEALELIAAQPPALIMLDMRMPVMDGWTFARELRSRGLEIPILVMTAARDVRRWAEEISADAYLSKPFELEDLLSAIKGLFEPEP